MVNVDEVEESPSSRSTEENTLDIETVEKQDEEKKEEKEPLPIPLSAISVISSSGSTIPPKTTYYQLYQYSDTCSEEEDENKNIVQKQSQQQRNAVGIAPSDMSVQSIAPTEYSECNSSLYQRLEDTQSVLPYNNNGNDHRYKYGEYSVPLQPLPQKQSLPLHNSRYPGNNKRLSPPPNVSYSHSLSFNEEKMQTQRIIHPSLRFNGNHERIDFTQHLNYALSVNDSPSYNVFMQPLEESLIADRIVMYIYFFCYFLNSKKHRKRAERKDQISEEIECANLCIFIHVE